MDATLALFLQELVRALANETAMTVMTLLVLANGALTLIAGHFLREFVRDVKDLTRRVSELDKQVAVLQAVLQAEIKHFASEP